MIRRWMVSVLSTGYDLADYRDAVITMLKEKGFDVSAYELSDFPVEPDMHSHDSCLVALSRVDLAVLIIDKRSGGVYAGVEDNTSRISITEAEYIQAINQGIPVFVFVRQKTYDEWLGYKKEFMEYCKKRKSIKRVEKIRNEFEKDYVCKYVEKVQTLRFVENIQNAYKDHSASNWMGYYSNIPELQAMVEGKLEGYSRFLIQKLSTKQEEHLLNRHTSTAMGLSLRDVFSSKYYIQPPHTIVSGKSIINSSGRNLSDAIEGVLATDNSILIYGEAGYGKTTVLAKCFSDHVQSLKKNPSYAIPLFLPLRNKGTSFEFDIERYIAEDMQEYFSRESYPYLKLADLRLRIYCDGFDELTESLEENDIEKIKKSSIFQYPLLLTCRQQFTTRYLSVYNFSDIFAVRIQMGKWDINIVDQYVTNLYKRKGKKDSEKKKIIGAIRENNDLQQLIDSPLLITMFLYFLENNYDEKNISDISRAELFRYWTIELAKRECSKSEGLTSSELLIIWEFTSWQLYLCRRNNDKLFKDDLAELIKEYMEISVDNVFQTYDALFEWKGDCISGTFHEQFMEYMVANLLIRACTEEKPPYPEFFKMVLRPEMNRYFRGIWKEQAKRTQDKIYDAVSKQYFDNLGKNEDDAVSIRVHAAYHMCRLDANKRTASIKRAFKLEDHISVLLSLYFGSIKLGDLDKEEELYQLLQDSDNSKANRGYHLTYYADIIQKGSMPYMDDDLSKWSGTLRAIERHFESGKIGHYYLRRIDLFTMKELMLARGIVAPLTQITLNKFGELISKSQYALNPGLEQFTEKIKREYDLLVATYNDLNR